MKRKLNWMIAAIMSFIMMSSATQAAVTITSFLKTGSSGAVTQSNVLLGTAGTVNVTISPGGIVTQTRYSFILDTGANSLTDISSIRTTITGPNGSFVVNYINSLFNTNSSTGSPTIGLYTVGDVNISSVDGTTIDLATYPTGSSRLVVASLTVPAGFSPTGNPDQVGETLSFTTAISGTDTSGSFQVSDTGTITVIPEPSPILLSALIAPLALLKRRR